MSHGKDKKKIEDILKKCPPGYGVAHILIGGNREEVVMFSNYNDGLAYFNVDGQVGVYEADKIRGILFGAADAVAEAAEEEEADEE